MRLINLLVLLSRRIVQATRREYVSFVCRHANRRNREGMKEEERRKMKKKLRIENDPSRKTTDVHTIQICIPTVV